MTAISEALSDEAQTGRLRRAINGLVHAEVDYVRDATSENREARDAANLLVTELLALRSGNGGEVRVKALEWAQRHSGFWLGTGVVNYCLWEHPNGLVDVTSDGKIIRHAMTSVEEAKAAAQADFERRILSALDIKP